MRFIALYLLFFALILPASAHPGTDLDENNCHSCTVDCEAWGLAQDEYHCHNESNGYTNRAGDVFDELGVFLYNPGEVIEDTLPIVEDSIPEPDEPIITDNWLLQLESESGEESLGDPPNPEDAIFQENQRKKWQEENTKEQDLSEDENLIQGLSDTEIVDNFNILGSNSENIDTEEGKKDNNSGRASYIIIGVAAFIFIVALSLMIKVFKKK